MGEWQLIATAPKDGTLVLLCEVPHDWIAIGRYHVNDLWEVDSAVMAGTMLRPTHWMPLPSPPTQSSSRDSG